jgi:hypothetical protein
MAGIRIDFARDSTHPIVIEPAILPRISSADVTYHSARGKISVSWQHQQQQTVLDVTIPVNCSALVVLPAMAERLVREGTGPASQAAAVKFAGMDGESPVFSVESGLYHFSFPAPWGIAAAVNP